MKSLVINREDLKHNIRKIKEIAKDTGRLDNHKPIKIIAVVKGNGYGLGLIPYSKFLIDNVYVNGGAYTGRAVLKDQGVDEISVGPVVNYFYGKYGNNHGLRK